MNIKLYLDFLMASFSDKDTAQGFAGVGLMFTSAFIADFSFIIGALTAIGGCILVIVNVMIKIKEYRRLIHNIEKENDEYDSTHYNNDNNESADL